MTKADRLDWFRCFPSKWLNALAGLTKDEGYLYLIVCFRIYETGSACKDSNSALALRSRDTHQKVHKLLGRLIKKGKLYRTDAGLMNPFAADQLTERATYVTKKRESGKLGASVRHKKDEENQQIDGGITTVLPEHTYAQLHTQSTGTDSKKEIIEPQPDLLKKPWPSKRDAFERFYSCYPRKVDKAPAKKAFDKVYAEQPVSFEIFMAGVRREAEIAMRKGTTEYTKYPATWLNKRCWENNEPDPALMNPNGGTHANTTGKNYGQRPSHAQTVFAAARELSAQMARQRASREPEPEVSDNGPRTIN